MEFNEYVIHFRGLVTKAEVEPDHQVQLFMNSLKRGIIDDWHPAKMPVTLSEIIADIKNHLQVEEAKKYTKSGHSQKEPYSSYKSGSSKCNSMVSSMELWDHPKRAGPFASNPEKPIHNEVACRIYPKIKTNIENVKVWQGINTKYLAEGKGGIKSHKVSIKSVQTESDDEADVVNNIDMLENGILFDIESDDEISNITTDRIYTGAKHRSYHTHFFLDVSLYHPVTKRHIRAKALLDSGATRSFIGKRFSALHKIPMECLPKPQKLTLADGSSAPPIKHKSQEIELHIQGHIEKITLPVFDTKRYDFILGLDWLSYHNPSIDWELRKIDFTGYICKHPMGPHTVHQERRNVLAFTRDEITQEPPRAPIRVPEISVEEREVILKSPWPMSEFPDVFDTTKQKHLPKHRQDWDFDVTFKPNTSLPKSRPLFRLPSEQRKLTKEYITEELEAGKIRVSNSPIAANLFFVTKKDSTTELRPTVDYRDLNSCTIDDRYPLPVLKELIHKLSGAKWYSKFDLRWGYNNLRIVSGSEWKFAFKCEEGLFEPLVMPFGPKQAPSHFQRFI
ncbi:hypothetical protein SeLEV6574_g08544, partial [Synchytrium endobioticum]